MNRMVIETSVRQAGNDPIFRIAEAAKNRIATVGKDNVINSTLGALMDDNGNLVTFDSVYSVFRNLKDSEIASYAGIPGTPTFLNNVIDACFKSHRPKGYIRSIATPGGTGAIRHAIANYTEIGDKVLISDWHWEPYETIADENHRSVTTFKLFNENGNFNMNSYKSKMLELLNVQKRVLSIINSPAHNPTGYCLSDDEWREIVLFYTKTAKAHPEWRIILECDIAYIDFTGKNDESRRFMELLSDMPENVLVLYAYSASKAYTMYGLRNGAIICVAPNEEIADEFVSTCSYSNRGTWSNGTHGAMSTLAKITDDKKLKKTFENEQRKYKIILQQRAAAFVNAAKEINLQICHYVDGFFITIPCQKPKMVSEELMKMNFFIVELKNGLRFAPCAVSEEQCKKAPALIKKAMDSIEINA
ncbi:MAG: aminotransferase class I/II-fold pyridoxal phosphate-dependent enzyme [Eubacteriaceae bacterium]|nr:aminotransferase class I/II-fold pyridoxal phosphate-dependent enzyme [Eubacteriaceae bacterium]MDD4507704.1 aminotransferase class I/II-fold pyridoxal phosphate-dependent enzyme [Eubacteriaceae bacterium]